MENKDDRLARLRDTWAKRSAFREQHQAWYLERGAQCREPDEESELAKDMVCEWLLIHDWPDVDVIALNASELLSWDWAPRDPTGIDPERLVSALTEWFGWLCKCGLFDATTTMRFAYEIEDQREDFLEFVMPKECVSETAEGQALAEHFVTWLLEIKQRPPDLLGADDAVLAAALDTLGRVDGDVGCLDVTEWLDYAAAFAFDDPWSAELCALMRDALEWFELQGQLCANDRARLCGELERARRAARRREIAFEPKLRWEVEA